MSRSEVAIVTGAAQGLGSAIAIALDAAGMRVAIADIAVARAEQLARDIDPAGENARALRLDVTRKDDFTAAIAALADWGGVEVLINNAALSLTTPLMEIGGEEFDAVLAVNLRGPLFGSQVLGAHMRERGYGRIVNIASQAGQMGGTVTGIHYASSKAGLMLMTKVFARELAGTGVTVNAVAPGALDLPAVRTAIPPDRLAELEAAIPVGRLGRPEEIAAIVALLASRQAGYVTGATWDANGGTYMR